MGLWGPALSGSSDEALGSVGGNGTYVQLYGTEGTWACMLLRSRPEKSSI